MSRQVIAEMTEEEAEHYRAVRRARNARWRARHAERLQAHDRQRSAIPERREAHRLSTRDSKLRYPDHQRARILVGRAIRAGLLVRLPCERCGTKPTHAHHYNGYENPLDVQWLCAKHHGELHRG